MSQGLTTEESESDIARERRVHGRVEVEFAVRIQAPVRTTGQALELSEGGLRVEIGEDLSQAMHVSIEFDLPDRRLPIGVLADIRWHKQMGPKADPRWIYGLRFSEVDDEAAAAIERFVGEHADS